MIHDYVRVINSLIIIIITPEAKLWSLLYLLTIKKENVLEMYSTIVSRI